MIAHFGPITSPMPPAPPTAINAAPSPDSNTDKLHPPSSVPSTFLSFPTLHLALVPSNIVYREFQWGYRRWQMQIQNLHQPWGGLRYVLLGEESTMTLDPELLGQVDPEVPFIGWGS